MTDDGTLGPVSRIRIGQILRDSRPKAPTPEFIDGRANLYAAMASPGARMVPFDAGINPIKAVDAVDGGRTPAILIASSPHKLGAVENPWHDVWDEDNGWVRYYGDNRTPGKDPATERGNRALLAAYALSSHHDAAQRRLAPPLLLFRQDGAAKGFAQFWGVGLITGIELVTQYSPKAGGSFANYAFDLLILSAADEAETFDHDWITARRDPTLPVTATVGRAPAAYLDWVRHGHLALSRVRRRVSKLQIESRDAQLPAPGGPDATLLQRIYDHYSRDRHRFEGLAQLVAERVIDAAPGSYVPGGLTRGSGDGGIDFFARLDVGTGFGRAKLIVLGQAKCERPDRPTHGNHIARTVARLRRGWIGVYVTTSYFSASAQREVIDDRYPLILIGGRRLVEVVREMMTARGIDDVAALLTEIDQDFDVAIAPRDPEELLYR
jgi:hypothetical protein